MHDAFRIQRLNVLSSRKILVSVKLVLSACGCHVCISYQDGPIVAGLCFEFSLTFCKESKLENKREADKIIHITRRFLNRGLLLLIPTRNGQEGSFQVYEY